MISGNVEMAENFIASSQQVEPVPRQDTQDDHPLLIPIVTLEEFIMMRMSTISLNIQPKLIF
jgi:hypothetical protein